MKKTNDKNDGTHLASLGTSCRITGTVLQLDRSESFCEVEYPALGGGKAIIRIPRELFRTPTRVADVLVRAGADLPKPVPSVKAAVAAIQGVRLPHRDLTGRAGWHHDGSFVFPGETFGPRSSNLKFDEAGQIDTALGQKRGSLAGWRKGLRSAFKASDYLLFAASVAAASSLLGLIGQTKGALFHLHGIKTDLDKNGIEKQRSTSGKTTTARVGFSVVGRCQQNDLATFAITERAVEEFCFGHNHLTVAFDEDARAPRSSSSSKVDVSTLPYLVASGRGTLRSAKATQDVTLRNLSWAILALSTGENPLAACLRLHSVLRGRRSE